MLLQDSLTHSARIHPRRTALASGRIHLSYADLLDRVRRYAAALVPLHRLSVAREHRAILRNGWLHTGDVASLDEEGYPYILDRKRDTLMIGGISVSPREIETILAEHPLVAEATVVPRPHYILGEIPVAIVCSGREGQADAESLLDHCRKNLVPFKVPRAIEFLSSPPRNSAGKVLKTKLKERIVRGDVTPRTPRP